MKFSDVIGLETIKGQFIKDEIRNEIPHAQILIGNSGFGALPLAIAYAQYLLCENRTENDACGTCPACYKAGRLEHPDLHFVFPVNKSPYVRRSSDNGEIISDSLIERWREMVLSESQPPGYFKESQWYDFIELGKNAQGNISRAEASDIIRKMNYKSYQGGYKIVIIWLSERMNDTAANALLKLLEEPAHKTLFLLVCQDEEAMLKTILSRTRIIRIPPADPDSITQYLQQIGIQGDLSNTIATAACGDVIRAVERTNDSDISSKTYFTQFSSLMRYCFSVNHLGLIEWADQIQALPREVQKGFVVYALEMLRNAFMMAIGVREIVFSHGEERAFLEKFSAYVHHKNIGILTEEFEKVNRDLLQNGNPKIVFTHFALTISKEIYKLPQQ